MLAQRNDFLLLQTRAKWQIPNELRLERPKASLQAAIEVVKGIAPDAVFRSISFTYNCIGMVVASRRVWVDPGHLVRILNQDGYRRLPGVNDADRGDVVVYHDVDGEACHAGIVVARNLAIPGDETDPLTVLSKWGGDGEYIHQLSKVPSLLGRPSEYWTDRRHT